MEDTQIVALYISRSEGAISETEKKYGSYLKTIAGNLLPRLRKNTVIPPVR